MSLLLKMQWMVSSLLRTRHCRNWRHGISSLSESSWGSIVTATALLDPVAVKILSFMVLNWSMSKSRRSSWARGQTWVSCIGGRFLTIWATKETTICTKCYSKYFININPSNSYSRSKNELLLLASFHRWRNSSRERLTSSRSHNEWKKESSFKLRHAGSSSVLLIAPVKQSASVLMESDSVSHVNIHLVNLIHIPY